jgi:cytidine deaminase
VNGKRQAKAVAVYGLSRKVGVVTPPDALTPPCGLCRQFLHEVAELSSTDMTVILVTASQESAEVMKLSELLPLAFGPSSCGLDISKYVPKEN